MEGSGRRLHWIAASVCGFGSVYSLMYLALNTPSALFPELLTCLLHITRWRSRIDKYEPPHMTYSVVNKIRKEPIVPFSSILWLRSAPRGWQCLTFTCKLPGFPQTTFIFCKLACFTTSLLLISYEPSFSFRACHLSFLNYPTIQY